MLLADLLNNTLLLVCGGLLLTTFIYLCIYYGRVNLTIGRHCFHHSPIESQPHEEDLPSVSIVLTAHNESEALKKSLPYLLEQDYPNYEVVVVDYCSHDDTTFVLQVCAENYSTLRVVHFQEDVNMFQGRKYPLSIGIRSAKNDIILLTEPGCVPQSFQWVRQMARPFINAQTKIVLGHCAYEQPASFIESLAQYDNSASCARWIAAAIHHHPYTGTGRNLAYRRQFFFDNGAFIRHYSEPNGADDLFVNQNCTRSNTAVNIQPEAYVSTQAPSSRRAWRDIRTERFSTKKYYALSLKLRLALHPFALVLFYLSAIAILIFAMPLWYIPVAFIVILWAWNITTAYVLNKQIDIRKLRWLSPLLEIYFSLKNTISCLRALLSKKTSWR